MTDSLTIVGRLRRNNNEIFDRKMPYLPNEYPFYAVSIGGTSKCDGYICNYMLLPS